MHKKLNVRQMALETKLAGASVEKEAISPGVASAIGSGIGDVFEGAGSLAGSALEAGATTLDTVTDAAREGLGYAVMGATGTGLAAAYLAYKMNKPRAQDIDIDRNNLYIESLKAKIKEIRRKQAIAERKNKKETTKQPSLRLT